ncbi:MAG: 3-deoxy-D-manno-octulosonic acid transferase [Bacteroidetes bacterium]|nr:3-deoxy-D-manno-octulosonic acid transferase [Bacteroidota bacterium]MBU1116036.1 3-deoxy-D-manno-octulosonic acid transferase [Bacteroidota bacterium]MBU1799196.1 3-deoxy-D-manno-octulosonic acid transferase [Bacteroidota bacterium]
MKKLWWIVYNIFVLPILYLLFKIARLFNRKIRSGFDRRRLQNKFLKEEINSLDKSKKMIWFHSASLGEFEQAKPIIEKLRTEQNVNILVTFFSPSGYDNSKKYPHADVVAYIPFDFNKAVKEFLSIVKPDVVIFMRYDIWPNLLWQLGKNNIPTMIVDATMLKNSNRKIPIIKGFHISIYKCVSNILTVSPNDAKSFLDFKIPSEKIKSVGDTRFDRVYQKSLKAQSKKLFKDNLFNNKKIFVFGSSWEEDENVIFPAFEQIAQNNKDIIMIVAPHEPTELHLEKIENYFTKKLKTIRFSSKNNYSEERIIIIDSIGILLTLYFYANVAYVGGSFKQGIHNVLEPAVYGIPVIFGPKIEGSIEAKELIKRGASKIIKNIEEATTIMTKLFDDNQYRKKMGLIASTYVNENIGASNKILNEIEKYL